MEKKIYTNSLEACIESINNNFNMLEVDVWGIESGEIILGSRLKMQYPISIDYTIPTLYQLLKLICKDKNKKIILDIKCNTVDDFVRILNEIQKEVIQCEKNGWNNIKKQILIETFDEKTSSIASKAGWECLLTNYRNKDGEWIRKSCLICIENNIHTLMLDVGVINNHDKYLEYATRKNINIICYTVDDLSLLSKYKKLGCKSFLTNYLRV